LTRIFIHAPDRFPAWYKLSRRFAITLQTLLAYRSHEFRRGSFDRFREADGFRQL
jgi:hypothetical protein